MRRIRRTRGARQNDSITNIFGLNASTRVLTDYLIRAGYEFSRVDTTNSNNNDNNDIGGDSTTNTFFGSASRQFGLYTTGGMSTSYSFQTEEDTKIYNGSVFGAYGLPTGLSLSASVGYSILNSDDAGQRRSGLRQRQRQLPLHAGRDLSGSLPGLPPDRPDG